MTAKNKYQVWVSLTVAESKKLIALGLMQYAPLKERLEKGIVIITKGSTNSYLAKAIKKEIDQQSYVNGCILPSKGDRKPKRSALREELMMCKGEELRGDYTSVLSQMKKGDIVLKGANVINYKKGQAGVLIGHPTGGTCGNLFPVVDERKLRLIIPVGLEKDSSQDIDDIADKTKVNKDSHEGNSPYLWVIKGELFTEIEAIKQFAEIEVEHIASGGLGGAEGAVTLVFYGNEAEVIKAQELIKEIQGEQEFIS